MCGIVGILHVDSSPVPERLLGEMTDRLAHRGPDGRGTFIGNGVGLGHRRLAVLDLSDAGAQPMTTPDGRFTLTFNGEIYGWREMRQSLEKEGVRFRSDSDTEVVLHALARWGAGAVESFNGMFALALWDAQRQELLLARDRYGIKPLYTWSNGRTLLFSSEVKPLLQHPDVTPSLDPLALREYFTFQNLFGARTLFADVAMHPAATVSQIRRSDGLRVRETPYWAFRTAVEGTAMTQGEAEEEFLRLFEQAVDRQLVSDVEVGAYLSGGMDSGSITAVASRGHPNLKTFTCGFDVSSVSGIEIAFDERRSAETMSYLFGTEQYEMVLKAGDMERILPELTFALEDPRVGQCYPNYYVARLASRFVKVALSGAGGDELFAGYPWRYYRPSGAASFESFSDGYYAYWQRLLPEGAAPSFFRPIWGDVAGFDPRGAFGDVLAKSKPRGSQAADYIAACLDFEARTFLHGLLVVEDRVSMAHGLETRLPFLDNDLVDFGLEVPLALKLRLDEPLHRVDENDPGKNTARNLDRRLGGKLLVRSAMERLIPEAFTRGPKQGFSAPDASWFKGESIGYVRSLLMGPDARIFTFLDREAVQALVADHLEGRANRRLLIWSLLSLEWWIRGFIDGEAL
jgi:asparagine synthase (glutamine-hydrolysing)